MFFKFHGHCKGVLSDDGYVYWDHMDHMDVKVDGIPLGWTGMAQVQLEKLVVKDPSSL